MKNVLACIDASRYAISVTEHVAWAATRLQASVEVLHVIQRDGAIAERHDLSGAMGLGAKSHLLEELVQIDEAHSRVARESGKLLLASAEARLRDAGISVVKTTHRHGSIVENVIEREADADLVVIGKRGTSSQFDSEHLGSRVERVVRESTLPVLVASREFAVPTKVMIAFDGGASARKAVQFATRSPLLQDVSIDLVMAGKRGSGHGEQMAWAKAQLPHAVAHHLDSPADEAIPDFVNEHSIGLLVMGAYGHSPLRRFIVGSTTTTMMRRCQLPVLLFR